MQYDMIETLKRIALLGGAKHEIEISSKALGESMGVSQQTASKRLIDLEKSGAIKRGMSVKRQRITITEHGLKELRREYVEYRRIFEDDRRIYLSGVVASGVGEGRYYMSQKGYLSQFKKELGFDPYPGTLNVDLSEAEASKLQMLDAMKGVALGGFTSEGRTFGEVKCFKAKIKDIDCAVIIPKRTHYRHTVEIVAEKRLRDALGLADGSAVEIIVSGE
ncbi:MAG: DUF120 domain-containing protein [Candidatus Thermoplasmatota archaeon]|nr:DUF120 domain-containing protein [Candidatus Thermoplasmatota archaeon]